MKKIVVLNWKEIKIAYLTYSENRYWFKIIEENLLIAEKDGCPIEFIRDPKDIKDKYISKKMPIIFSEFEISNQRKDLINSCNITGKETEFERLCKVSSITDEYDRNEGFWIRTDDNDKGDD